MNGEDKGPAVKELSEVTQAFITTVIHQGKVLYEKN